MDFFGLDPRRSPEPPMGHHIVYTDQDGRRQEALVSSAWLAAHPELDVMYVDDEPWHQPFEPTDEPDRRFPMTVWNEMQEEYTRARKVLEFRAMASYHEGAAVIREEFEELWREIKGAQDPNKLRREAIQLGAMAAAFVMECVDGVEETARAGDPEPEQPVDQESEEDPAITRRPSPGDRVLFVDERGGSNEALVCDVAPGDGDPHPQPPVQLVYIPVDPVEEKRFQFNLVCKTGIPHRLNRLDPGEFWRWAPGGKMTL